MTGCGPGHWTHWLSSLGTPITGLDPVSEFVELARVAYPSQAFRVGRAEDTGAAEMSLAGVLAWYSLIHTDPTRISAAFAEFHRVLRPGGGLAVGFFEGSRLEPFEHAVTTAYLWPLDVLVREVETAGFTVAHTETRTDPGSRPHGAITALRR